LPGADSQLSQQGHHGLTEIHAPSWDGPSDRLARAGSRPVQIGARPTGECGGRRRDLLITARREALIDAPRSAMQGENDIRVPRGQAQQVTDALKAKGNVPMSSSIRRRATALRNAKTRSTRSPG